MVENNEITIFIVEDEPIFISLIKYQLLKLNLSNYHIFVNGEICLKHLDIKPDVVILDYNLGGINGIEVLKKIKKLYLDAYVIMFSSNREEEMYEECMKHGADEYIEKNVTALIKVKNTLSLLMKKVEV
ncbi:MAG TPA: hypothetical protein DDX39_05825 [Bacteroidales bacterium]|nr:MAG: hypothetical protein A2W98_07095 [Bacteroidetes bacterium GWF2_33_38]OFY76395.1 MAG: hypothetical protein A2265_01860 [Bacteroidetes bacterium RIFOXYA12_FULL_33_9]HBF88143.1 hypothetical protein [Bacteroidales bacterium]